VVVACGSCSPPPIEVHQGGRQPVGDRAVPNLAKGVESLRGAVPKACEILLVPAKPANPTRHFSIRTQHKRRLSVRSAQVWFCPTATANQVLVPATWVGSRRRVVVPSPSCPALFRPCINIARTASIVSKLCLSYIPQRACIQGTCLVPSTTGCQRSGCHKQRSRRDRAAVSLPMSQGGLPERASGG